MLIAWLLTALDLLAGVVPSRFLYALARGAGALSIPVLERRRIAVRANQQRLHPEWGPRELDAAVRRVFEETTAYYIDAAVMARRTPRDILANRLTVEGIELLQEANQAGRGVVLAGAHLSNPEVPFHALAAVETEAHASGTRPDALALVEPVANRRQMAALQRRRKTAGARFAPATLDGVRQAVETLRAGGIVAVLIDRDIQGKGLCLPFAGRQARFPSGAIDLALRTEATLLIGVAIRERNDRFRVRFLPTDPLVRSDNRALDIRLNLANLVRCIEPEIVAHSDQWRVVESIWAPCHDTFYEDPADVARGPEAVPHD